MLSISKRYPSSIVWAQYTTIRCSSKTWTHFILLSNCSQKVYSALCCKIKKIKSILKNVLAISRSLLPVVWSMPLTWSFCESPPPAAWCDPPWIQFFPACEPGPFADGQCDPQARSCRPLGSCLRPPLKDLTGYQVTALQHHRSRHGVRSRSLGSGGREIEINLETCFLMRLWSSIKKAVSY